MIRPHPIPPGLPFAARARAVLLIVPAALALAVSPAAMAAQQAVSTPTPQQGGVDGPFRPRQPVAATASASASATSTGADLARQARSRLAASLATNAALSDGRTITAAQARANGLPFIARHFDQIDTAHSGRVSLQQVRQYLQREPR
ncbi:MAG: hypothetical protein V4764_18225 [Burkholderia sp.]